MSKLTDTQLVILNAAAARGDHAVLPLPKSLKANKGATTIVLNALLKKGLIEEYPARPGAELWRQDKDGRPQALTITEAGLAALEGGPTAKPKAPARSKKASPPPKKAKEPTGKAATILKLLVRPSGASIAQLQKATGWQAHSVRAALTGLRKRGIEVHRSDKDGTTVYRAKAA